MTPRLILASASPRRLELLRQVGLDPEVLAADIDETPRANEPPSEYVVRIAQEKGRAVARRFADRPVLSADTIVLTRENEIFGKPKDGADAARMLRALSDGAHSVVTCYALFWKDLAVSESVSTTVWFRALFPEEIDGYVASDEWSGKAGGYAIQGLAAAFVHKVSGSYANVVGLPVCEVVSKLREIGVLDADWLRE